ncbi:MAG: cation:proton antiporter [Odoribacter sp.]
MKKQKKNLRTYLLMILLFGSLIYITLDLGGKFTHTTAPPTTEITQSSAFSLFSDILAHNVTHPFAVLLLQIIVILLAVRLFSGLFKRIGQPRVIGEIVAGIVLGPSLLGYFFPDLFTALFPVDSLTNLELFSQIGLMFFMFVIGMEVDFNLLKEKINETLVISHAGIIVPFFLGTLSSFWVYEQYAAAQTEYLPFALFLGISMSITAFPVLARIIQERNLTHTPIGMIAIAAAANDDVTAWCLLAIVIAVAQAGSFVSALFTIALVLAFIAFMFGIVRPFLRKIGLIYANSEVINKSFVGFIFLILVLSSVTTEIIGIHALFGAFIAGVVMPVNTGFRKVMMEKVEDISLVFFLPLFFAFTGLRTEIGLIDTPELWGVCALLICVAILGKLGGCTLAARLVGESWKNSFIVGTLMNTRGLMELVALNIGYEMGILPPKIFVILVLMALSTTFMTTPLLRLVEYLFKEQPLGKQTKSKLLLSFGRSESGRDLLALTGLLFGKSLQHINIIAAHYTIGSDLSPDKAQHYAQESFQPLEQEAKRWRIDIDKRYKVTDRLTWEISHLANREKANITFVCAGPQFLENNIIHPQRLTLSLSLLQRLGHLIHNRSLRLAGNLTKDKLYQLIEKINCPVGVFIRRSDNAFRHVFFLVNGEKDLLFIEDLCRSSIVPNIPIHICPLETMPKSLYLDQRLAALNERFPGIFLQSEIIDHQEYIYDPDHLVIMSEATCRELSHDTFLFSSLPSLMIIYKK